MVTYYGMTIEENPALADETLLSMSDARHAFPREISRSCLERMIRVGARGVRLETLFVANRRYTSQEAIRRFIERTQNAPQEASAPSKPAVSRIKSMTVKQLEVARKKFNLPVPD